MIGRQNSRTDKDPFREIGVAVGEARYSCSHGHQFVGFETVATSASREQAARKGIACSSLAGGSDCVQLYGTSVAQQGVCSGW